MSTTARENCVQRRTLWAVFCLSLMPIRWRKEKERGHEHLTKTSHTSKWTDHLDGQWDLSQRTRHADENLAELGCKEEMVSAPHDRR